MIDVLQNLTPSDLGFDERQFPSYRDVQLEAIERAVYSDERFQAIAAPAGAGKSLIAASIQRLTGWRTALITPIKGHQDQYIEHFGSIGLWDIRGKANYPCQDQHQLTCRDGQRIGCRLHSKDSFSACLYDETKRRAKNAQFVSANFAYWLNVNDKALGLERNEREGRPNPFECLIVDEAHLAPNVLAEYLAVRIYEKELKDLVGMDGLVSDKIGEWKHFAADIGREVGMQIENMERHLLLMGKTATSKELEHASRLESLADKLGRIQETDDADWVCEFREGTKYGRSWEFDVIWPGRYAERYLFTGIPRVILMSATLRPKTMGLLGIRKDEYGFHEWPRIFPASRNPLYFLPVSRNGKAVRLNYHSTDEDLQAMVDQVDRIIDGRLDRKILIHSVSYARQEYLIAHSRHRKIMTGNTADPDSGTASDICQMFKEIKPPAILVSPSFGTGWDFPRSDVEVIILPKIPFPNGKSKVMKARRERDESYLNYIAMQELVQASGRGMRSADDRCEVYIVDGSLSWFMNQNRSLAPRWFANAIQTINAVPIAPEKLQ